MWILPLYVEKIFSSIQAKLTHNDPFSLPAWYLYEYLFTLHAEVDVIWRSKLSLTTILFLINRYAFILNWSFSLVFNFLLTNSVQVSHPVTET